MPNLLEDIQAVTQLLEQKEKDLDLTVKIGMELLTHNTALETRIAELEKKLSSSKEDRLQLAYEIKRKNELISVLTNEETRDHESHPMMSMTATLNLLEKKINTLQEENKTLENDVSELAWRAVEVEKKLENQMMNEIATQLKDTTKQLDKLNLETAAGGEPIAAPANCIPKGNIDGSGDATSSADIQ